jgi:hypothetical protein
VLAQGQSTIALPANTFVHSDPEMSVVVEAMLEDGEPLPTYVKFDPETMTFEIDGDAAFAAGDDRIVILLIGKDTQGNSASTIFVISVQEPEDSTEITDETGELLIPDGEAAAAEGDGEAETSEEEGEAPTEQEANEDPEQANGQNGENEQKQQTDGRKSLDLQLAQASRYNFGDRIEQLLEDIKSLFT